MDYNIQHTVFTVNDFRIINNMPPENEIRLSTRFTYSIQKNEAGSYLGHYLIEICKEDEIESADKHFFVRIAVATIFTCNTKRISKALSEASAREVYPEIRVRLSAILSLVGITPIPLPSRFAPVE